MKPHQPTASLQRDSRALPLPDSTLLAPLTRVHPPRSSLPAASKEAPRHAFTQAPQETSMDSAVIDELTKRLPTSELVKIIKGALECGKRNLPFTESDLLRTMAFGTHTPYTRASTGPGSAPTRR
jgi:hypothetical protein